MKQIILATSSPYRQEAFRFLDLDFITQGSNVDESFDERPDFPEELVFHLAKLKAKAVAKNYDAGFVIGFDSVGYFNGNILEKPKSREEAFQRLKSLSGNTYEFLTGIFIIDLETKKEISKVITTKIKMRKITDIEINKYLDQDPNFKTYSVGYDSLGHYSSTFVMEINGSYNNFLRGIPLETIIEMLVEIGYKI